MNLQRFTTGGAVIHGITWLSRGRVSAWYGPQGLLVDAELIDSRGRSHAIKRSGPLWLNLARLSCLVVGE